MSSDLRFVHGITSGFLKAGTINNIQWHQDGSFYLKGSDTYAWASRSKVADESWKKLWPEVQFDMLGPHQFQELAVSEQRLEIRHQITNISQYVALDAHARNDINFAFIKKQAASSKEVHFVMKMGSEPVQSCLQQSERRLQPMVPPPEASSQWAYSTRAGRSHQDAWELKLAKGEKLRVERDMGKGWYVVVAKNGVRGWVHSSWLDFSDRSSPVREAPKPAWSRFSSDAERMLRSEPISEFPVMTEYVDACTSAECMPAKRDGSSLGICAHDLKMLLEGSDSLSVEFVKNERNRWHPDKFARLCAPTLAEELKVRAEKLFVLHGMVMEQM